MAKKSPKNWRDIVRRLNNYDRGVVYTDRGQRKAISRDLKVIDFRVICNTAIRMAKTCRLASMNATKFVKQLKKKLNIGGHAIGRICESRLFKLYLRLFYFAVERPKYLREVEFDGYYRQLYLAA